MLSLPHQSYKCVTKLISPLINGVIGPYLKLVTLCPLSLGIQLYSQMMIKVVQLPRDSIHVP